jgi:hypothetical protein
MNTPNFNYKDNYKKTNTTAIPVTFAQGGLHDVQSLRCDVQSLRCITYQHQAKNTYRDVIFIGQAIYLYIFYLK